MLGRELCANERVVEGLDRLEGIGAEKAKEVEAVGGEGVMGLRKLASIKVWLIRCEFAEALQ